MDTEPMVMESTEENSIMIEEEEDEEAVVVREPIITEFDLNGPDGKDLADIITIDERKREHQVTPMTELLQLHHKFNHISMSRLRRMAKCGALPRRLAECDIPVCTACMYAKAARRPWRSKSTKEQEEEIKPPTKPGEVVSVDQLRSPTPGLVAQMTGNLTTKRYNYATVFVDQYSRLGYVYVQKTQSAEETLEAKEAFERYASSRGVNVKAYHADNGVFRANAWYEACRKNSQSTTFAGVNAHHMNGIAERRIKELQEMTRASLAHANYRWSDAITANLWPYAMRLANEAFNATPVKSNEHSFSPAQLFAGSKVNANKKHFQPFGCPVYVLNQELQQQKPYHKWKERAEVGIYLGRSPQHQRNVALVLNLSTGLVSPQFHVSFDPTFETIQDQKHPLKSLWQAKAGFVREREHEETGRLRVTFEDEPRVAKRPRKGGVGSSSEETELPKGNDTSETTPQENEEGVTTPPEGEGTSSQPLQQMTNQPEPVTRSGRAPKPVQRLIEAMETEISTATKADVEGEILSFQALCPHDVDATQEGKNHPLTAFKATADPDTMYMHEAMKEPDRQEFIKAMQKEVLDQMNNGNFSLIKRVDVPEDKTILRAVWQMKRKRDIKTRAVKKWKARLNIDGSKMKYGTHYDETYAPVARWNSIRLLLSMAAIHGWHTTQIDYVLAFPQAPVERDLYMEVPKGFEVEGAEDREYVLQLHRNVYGQKQASRVWNKYLVDKLVNVLGFVQSKTDECVFYRGSVVYLLYTDDSILAGPDQKEINKVIKDLKKAKLDITVEGDIQDFLGVNIEKHKNGTIRLTQPHLIDAVLDDLRMNNDQVVPKTIPAKSSEILGRHDDSEPFDNSFNYRSVIGKLNYLEKGSRPDIAYIVHQCARFTANPKVEHGKAIRWLGRYLKGTRDKGMILRPNGDLGLEVYVDADFVGNYKEEDSSHPDTARSRHGYIVSYGGCPIQWKSQLQTEITLSSTESEYTGLSYALRDAIPMMNLLDEMEYYGFPVFGEKPTVHCRVYEDNSGALAMAKEFKYRPRTKHLCVKLHHFRHYVEAGRITVLPISTELQPADMLTKPLNDVLHKRHRKTVMGW
jgi:hypothetical protein